MPIYVGCSGSAPPQKRYYETLTVAEMLPSQHVPPKASSVKRWAEGAPDGFRFTMVASRFLSATPSKLPPGLEGDPKKFGGLQLTEENRGLYERTVAAATALGAKVLVFETSSQLRPGVRGREAMTAFFSAIDRGGLQIAWEPHGPWEEEDINGLCSELDLIRCFDPLRDRAPEGAACAYARLGPFAVMGRSIADDELEDILDVLEDFDEAYCLFATERAQGDAKRLLEMSAL